MTAPDVAAIATARLGELEAAWNHADGAAFGAPFADETSFVDIRGEHHHGDGALIGHGHQAIFDTIYAGSTVRYRLETARLVTPGTIVAVAVAMLDAPTGPLQGRHHSRLTLLLIEEGDRWAIAAFHNTLVQTPGRQAGAEDPSTLPRRSTDTGPSSLTTTTVAVGSS